MTKKLDIHVFESSHVYYSDFGMCIVVRGGGAGGNWLI